MLVYGRSQSFRAPARKPKNAAHGNPKQRHGKRAPAAGVLPVTDSAGVAAQSAIFLMQIRL